MQINITRCLSKELSQQTVVHHYQRHHCRVGAQGLGSCLGLVPEAMMQQKTFQWFTHLEFLRYAMQRGRALEEAEAAWKERMEDTGMQKQLNNSGEVQVLLAVAEVRLTQFNNSSSR